MKKCNNDINNKCSMLALFKIHTSTKGRFCKDFCCPNNPAAMKAMLAKFNIEIDEVPLDIKELEAKIERGEVKRNMEPVKKAPCKGCGQVKNIVKGFSRLVWSRMAKTKPEQFVVDRAEICAKCEYRTFLPVTKWAIGFVSKGDLPINHEPNDWDALWCSRCKCCLEAKILVKDEKCPIDKWKI